jgi:hypothetical protein
VKMLTQLAKTDVLVIDDWALPGCKAFHLGRVTTSFFLPFATTHTPPNCSAHRPLGMCPLRYGEWALLPLTCRGFLSTHPLPTQRQLWRMSGCGFGGAANAPAASGRDSSFHGNQVPVA